MSRTGPAREPDSGAGKAQAAPGKRRWLRRLAITAVVLAVVYIGFGFLGVPLIARHVVVPRISDSLNGTVELERAAFNPFTFNLTLDGLTIADEAGEAVMGFERFEGNFELLRTVFQSGLHFSTAKVARPSIRGRIDEDGSFNLLSLLRAGETIEVHPPPELPHVVVTELAVTGARIDVEQLNLPEPFELTIEPLDFAVDVLDTRPEHDNPHYLTALTTSGAVVEWNGTVHADPLTARGTISITHIPLQQGSPFAALHFRGRVLDGRLNAEVDYEFAPVANPPVARVAVREAGLEQVALEIWGEPLVDVEAVRIAGAAVDAVARTITVETLSTSGANLRVRRDEAGQLAFSHLAELGAAGEAVEGDGHPARFTVAYTPGTTPSVVVATQALIAGLALPWTLHVGQITVTDSTVALTDEAQTPPVEMTLETENAQVASVDVATADRSISIDSVRVVVPRIDARLGLLPRDAAPEGKGASAEGTVMAAGLPFNASIGNITVEVGSLVAHDDRSEPPATIELTALKLETSGIETASAAPVPFTLASRLQGSGRLEISGDVNPFAEDPFASANVTLDGIPVKSFDPLAGPYIGYGIESGRMAVVFPVTLEGNRVEGELDFTFDTLHLGDKVQSPHAPDAPIKLGLDLMRDSNDRIKGTIPIEGDVTDPNFSIGGLISGAFLNTLGNIATAPFKMLGSLFGGGDDVDISLVEFEAGSAVLSGDALSKLDVLGRAMLERPALTLAATGRYAPAADDEVMRMLLLRERVQERAREQNPLIETLNDEAYLTWAQLLYKWEIGPVENEQGNPRSFEEMNAALLAATEIPEKRKVALAQARVDAVLAVLVAENGVPEDRVKVSVGKDDELLSDSPRVDFALE